MRYSEVKFDELSLYGSVYAIYHGNSGAFSHTAIEGQQHHFHALRQEIPGTLALAHHRQL